MAKKRLMSLDGFLALAGILASIAVGNALVLGVLVVPLTEQFILINQLAGWGVMIGGVIGGLKFIGIMR